MRRLALVLSTLLVLVACSGDDDDDATPASTAPSTVVTAGTDESASTTIPEPDVAVDPTGTGLVCEVVGEPVAVANVVVDVSASDYEFTASVNRLSDGEDAFVQFVNNGDGPHEVQFVALEDPADLPLDADGRVDLDDIDEFPKLGPIGGGDSCEGTYQLGAGTYVLFSNLVTAGGENYLDLGMVATFTIE